MVVMRQRKGDMMKGQRRVVVLNYSCAAFIAYTVFLYQGGLMRLPI